MALFVVDDSKVGIQKTPSGGFAIQLSEIPGLPEGLTLLIPFEGEIANTVYDSIGEKLGRNPSSILAASPAEAEEEAARHGLNPTD